MRKRNAEKQAGRTSLITGNQQQMNPSSGDETIRTALLRLFRAGPDAGVTHAATPIKTDG